MGITAQTSRGAILAETPRRSTLPEIEPRSHEGTKRGMKSFAANQIHALLIALLEHHFAEQRGAMTGAS
jgi:hypothetical protein